MTPAELAADRAVIEAATPGPWSNVDTTHWAYPCVFVGEVPSGTTYDPLIHRRIAELSCTRGKVEREIENAEFIAAARQRWPAALDEIERLQAELADVRAAREIDARNRVQDRVEAGDEIERLRAKLAARGIDPDSDG